MEDAKNKAHHIAEECTSETGVSQGMNFGVESFWFYYIG